MVRSKVPPLCRECGKGTSKVQLFVLALNERQLRGYWHPASFKKVQRDVIMATCMWIKVSEDPEDE